MIDWAILLVGSVRSAPLPLRVFYVVSDCQSVVTRSVTATSPNCLRMDEYGPPEIPNYRTILFMSDDLIEFDVLS